MREFRSADEVRQWLRARGVTERVRIRQTLSPFTGSRCFTVALVDVPRDVAVVTALGSDRPVQYGSSDSGQTAVRYAALEAVLKGTNAFPST